MQAMYIHKAFNGLFKALNTLSYVRESSGGGHACDNRRPRGNSNIKVFSLLFLFLNLSV